MLGECNVHVWASICSWLADLGDADGGWYLRQLRGTSRRGVLGFDCAVHAGWVPLAAHDSGCPDQDGATCRWVDRWVPVSIAECADLHEQRHTLRLEHMLVPQARIPTPRNPWTTPATVLCETAAINTTVEFARHPMRAEGAGAVAAYRRQEMLAGLHASSLSFALDPAHATEHLAGTSVNDAAGCAVVTTPLLHSFRSGPLTNAFVTTVKRIDLGGLSGLVVTKDSFLSAYTELEQVSFAPLRNLRAIGCRCCSYCAALVSLDLSGPMPHLVRIDKMAFNECHSLTDVSLAGLTNVTRIGSGFLQSARSLLHLDTRGLTSVETIEDVFVADCKSLQSVNLHGLRSLTQVGDSFFANNRSLAVVDLSALPGLTRAGSHFFGSCGAETVSTADGATGAASALVHVGQCWFAGCERLRAIDISGLNRLSTAGTGFLKDCERLEEITVSHASPVAATAPGLAALESAGPWFLARCPRLRTVDAVVGTMRRLEHLGLRAFAECSGLESFSCAGLGNCAVVDHHWLFRNDSLRSISFVGLSSRLTTLPETTLALAAGLTSVDTAGLESITAIHGQFMQHCAALEHIDTRGLVGVTSIGPSFLMGAGLRRFSAGGLTALTQVGNSFLAACPRLEALDTCGMEHVATLGNNFAGGCEALTSVDARGLVSVTTVGRGCHPLCVLSGR